jgi:hypothetical protein
MVLSFLTNPYNKYYAADLKEFIALDKLAKEDFRPDTHFDLLPRNVDACAVEIEKYAKQFGYSFLLNVPTTRQVDTTNANLFAYSNSNLMLETWNRVMDKNIAINANEIWGTQDWTQGTNDFQIAEMTHARGKVGMANVVTIVGRKKFFGEMEIYVGIRAPISSRSSTSHSLVNTPSS